MYAQAGDAPVNQRLALDLLEQLYDEAQGVLPTQVLQEYCDVALKKLHLPARHVRAQLGSSMASRSAPSALVYSTDSGRMCPGCRHPVAGCQCVALNAAAPVPGKVRVNLETKGRGGKSVTVVRGLALESAALAELGRQLRAACGSGGTARDGVVEVQGDHVERVRALLQKQALLR